MCLSYIQNIPRFKATALHLCKGTVLVIARWSVNEVYEQLKDLETWIWRGEHYK